MEVLAYRDISPGEEITINCMYLLHPPSLASHTTRTLELTRRLDAYLGMPRTERQAFLRKTWSFTCACPLCTSPPSLVAASDTRRRAIAAKRVELAEARREGRHTDAVQIAGEAAALCEEEGLEALVSEFWGVMAKGYLEMGRVDEASLWAGRTVDGWRAFKGVDSEAFGEAERLVRATEMEAMLG